MECLVYCLFSRRSSLSLSPSNRPRNQAYPSSCMIRAKPNPLRGPATASTNSPEHRDWTLEHLFRLQDPSPHHPHQQHPCPPRECATAPRILTQLPRRAGEHSAKQAPESSPVVCRITTPGPWQQNKQPARRTIAQGACQPWPFLCDSACHSPPRTAWAQRPTANQRAEGQC